MRSILEGTALTILFLIFVVVAFFMPRSFSPFLAMGVMIGFTMNLVYLVRTRGVASIQGVPTAPWSLRVWASAALGMFFGTIGAYTAPLFELFARAH